MKKVFSIIAAVISLVSWAEISTPTGFTDDYYGALKRAEERGTLIYIVFSGSDWCGGCMGLERQLLSKSEFVDGVKDNWELVFIDCPKDASRLSELGKKQNGQIRGKFGVNRFPTVYILDKTGGKIANGDTGLGSTPAQVAERMNKFKIKYIKKAKLNAKIEGKKPGLKTRVMAIHQYLQSLSFEERESERELIKEVVAADKKQNLGLKDAYFYYTDIEPIFVRLQSVSQKYLMSEDKKKLLVPFKKELSRLETQARALKAPKEELERKKELIEAIKEAKAWAK